MKGKTGSFLLPRTALGWSAAGVTMLFVLLWFGVTSELLRFSGLLTMVIGVTGGIMTLLAITWKKDRAALLWLALLPGLFAIVFALGEVLYPH